MAHGESRKCVNLRERGFRVRCDPKIMAKGDRREDICRLFGQVSANF